MTNKSQYSKTKPTINTVSNKNQLIFAFWNLNFKILEFI